VILVDRSIWIDRSSSRDERLVPLPDQDLPLGVAYAAAH
jgi:hypothetical protein